MDHNQIDLGIVSQSKMHANVAGTQVARISAHAAQKFSCLLKDFDARSECVHVSSRLFQANLDPVVGVQRLASKRVSLYSAKRNASKKTGRRRSTNAIPLRDCENLCLPTAAPSFAPCAVLVELWSGEPHAKSRSEPNLRFSILYP
jgi:hypothetical protein